MTEKHERCTCGWCWACKQRYCEDCGVMLNGLQSGRCATCLETWQAAHPTPPQEPDPVCPRCQGELQWPYEYEQPICQTCVRQAIRFMAMNDERGGAGWTRVQKWWDDATYEPLKQVERTETELSLAEASKTIMTTLSTLVNSKV